MLQLAHEMRQILATARGGSHTTRARLNAECHQIAQALDDAGWTKFVRQKGSARSLKSRHAAAIVQLAQKDGLAPGTIKNRLTTLRRVVKLSGRQGAIHKSNAYYGVGQRVQVTNQDRGVDMTDEKIKALPSPRLQASAGLQKAFGLRISESVVINPRWADRGDKLVLKGSWCKGRRPRTLDIRTPEQRAALDFAKKVAGRGSLIAPGKTRDKWLSSTRYYYRKIGISRTHGVRHRYAQIRYRELTGWDCVAVGGTAQEKLTPEQKTADRQARLQISDELGHERLRVTSIYLGGRSK